MYDRAMALMGKRLCTFIENFGVSCISYANDTIKASNCVGLQNFIDTLTREYNVNRQIQI